jgi:hypothetical protein
MRKKGRPAMRKESSAAPPSRPPRASALLSCARAAAFGCRFAQPCTTAIAGGVREGSIKHGGVREGSMMRSAGEVRGEDGATAGWRGVVGRGAERWRVAPARHHDSQETERHRR